MIRVYADTSVFGGVFDTEFSVPSQAFFDDIARGRFSLVTSAVVRTEISAAPKKVQEFFESVTRQSEIAEFSEEVLALRQAYIDANVVTSQSLDDAAHVALATLSGCHMIISWNFKHIVHFEKIPKYNDVNLRMGFQEIDIYSPLEVISYDEE